VIVSWVVAADENDVIGRDGALPWHLPDDMKRFKRLTSGHAVVAGRATHDSIVERLGRPLPGRITLVASRTVTGATDGVIYLPSVADAVTAARSIEALRGGDEVFVIGGSQIYQETLDVVDRIHFTRVLRQVDGDCALPSGWLAGFRLVEKEPHEEFRFETYERERP
jgi:dihydrofolate reductase